MKKLQNEQRRFRTRVGYLYGAWKNMLYRCYNKRCPDYPRYGGRGIIVCARWKDAINGFTNFTIDMGHRPDSTYSLQRKDNDAGYSKENCCWATPKEQRENQRRPAMEKKTPYMRELDLRTFRADNFVQRDK